MEVYEKTFEVLWADLDPNFHVRHTAYNDYAAHVRFTCLAENGFPLEKFAQLNVGPVIFNENTSYLNEVRSGDSIRINFLISGLSSDLRKYRIQHEVFRGDGKKAAEITVDGAWFDTKIRKIVTPPEDLIKLLKDMPVSQNFNGDL